MYSIVRHQGITIFLCILRAPGRRDKEVSQIILSWKMSILKCRLRKIKAKAQIGTLKREKAIRNKRWNFNLCSMIHKVQKKKKLAQIIKQMTNKMK